LFLLMVMTIIVVVLVVVVGWWCWCLFMGGDGSNSGGILLVTGICFDTVSAAWEVQRIIARTAGCEAKQSALAASSSWVKVALEWLPRAVHMQHKHYKPRW
jgi:uncharacterized membrane protein YqiK